MMPTKTHSAGFMQASYRALALLLIALLSPFPALLAYWADASGDGINDVWVDSAYGTVFTLPELDAFSDDIDGDGLSNAQELQLGTDPFRPDTDEDGLIDGVDPAPADLRNFSSSNSREWFSDALGGLDGDGVLNFFDVWPEDSMNGVVDSDGDGIPDRTDPAQ
jgi:hypothetical protein